MNFDIDTYQYNLNEVVIKKMTMDELLLLGIDQNLLIEHHAFKSFPSSTLLLIKMDGNNFKLIAQRAREKGKHVLGLLRVFLNNSPIISDENLLYKLSEYALVINTSNNKVGWSGKMDRRAFKLQIHSKISELMDNCIESNNKLVHFNEEMQSRIKRAIQWISNSIVEYDLDLKVVLCCSALETLLSTKSDRRKGEAIVYRMVLLHALSDAHFPQPSRLLEIYELRSSIIHGSKLNISQINDYYFAKFVCNHVIKLYIDYIDSQEIKKQSEFIRTIETSSEVDKAIDNFNTLNEYDKRIRQALIDAKNIHANSN